MTEDTSTIEKILAWGALAGFGGAVKYLSAVLRSPETVTKGRFILLLSANVFISAFCGLMGMLLAITMTDSWAFHGLAAGCVGYMGTQGLDIILLSLKKKIQPSASPSAVIPIPPQ